MYNTAISLVQDATVAEDITQEVFITVYRSVGSFNEKSELGTWIYRITVNKCLDHLRSKNRQKRHGIFSRFFGADSGDELPAASHFDHPGIKLEQKEYARYLFEAIDSLPEAQRTAFVLAQIEELPQKEIAMIMNISLKAVESLLQRGKAGLRKKLDHLYDRRNKQ